MPHVSDSLCEQVQEEETENNDVNLHFNMNTLLRDFLKQSTYIGDTRENRSICTHLPILQSLHLSAEI